MNQSEVFDLVEETARQNGFELMLVSDGGISWMYRYQMSDNVELYEEKLKAWTDLLPVEWMVTTLIGWGGKKSGVVRDTEKE